MRIGIIGAGNVGLTLGAGWAKAGHSIFLGVRDPDKIAQRGGLPGAEVRSIRGAVEESEVLLLTTPWAGAEDALRKAGDFGGRILLDATNPIGPGGVLTVGHTNSGGELVQSWAQGAKVVKIFNTTGRENMADPHYGDQAATMFLCGDDPGAREVAAQLARDLGFEPVSAGGLSAARLLEPLGRLWIELAMFQGQGRGIALRLLHR